MWQKEKIKVRVMLQHNHYNMEIFEIDDVRRMKQIWRAINLDDIFNTEYKTWTRYVEKLEQIVHLIEVNTIHDEEYDTEMTCYAMMIDARNVLDNTSIELRDLYKFISGKIKIDIKSVEKDQVAKDALFFCHWLQLSNIACVGHVSQTFENDMYGPWLLIVWDYYL